MAIDFTKEELREFMHSVRGAITLDMVQGLLTGRLSAEGADRGRAMFIRIEELVEEYGP